MKKDQVGFSSILPSKVSVRFRTRCCSGTTPPPSHWELEVDAPAAADLTLGGSLARVVVEDSAYAVFAGGSDPTNKEKLTDLAKSIAREVCVWRENQGDHVIAGIVAPEMNAQNDSVEWQMDDEACLTTFSSGPFVQECDLLMHHDPESWCEVPCDAIEVYGADMTVVDGKVRIPTYSAWLDDDRSPPRVRTKRKSQTDFRACCDNNLYAPGCVCPGGAPRTWDWTWTTYPNVNIFNQVLAAAPSPLGTTTGTWVYFDKYDFIDFVPTNGVYGYKSFSVGPGWMTNLKYYTEGIVGTFLQGDCRPNVPPDQVTPGINVYVDCFTTLLLCKPFPYPVNNVLTGTVVTMATRTYTQLAPGEALQNQLFYQGIPFPSALSDSFFPRPGFGDPGYQPVVSSCSPFIQSYRKFAGRTVDPPASYYSTYTHSG